MAEKKKKPAASPSVKARMTGIADLPEPELPPSQTFTPAKSGLPSSPWFTPSELAEGSITGELRRRAGNFLSRVLNPHNLRSTGERVTQLPDRPYELKDPRSLQDWWSPGARGIATNKDANVDLADTLLSQQYPEAVRHSNSVRLQGMPSKYWGLFHHDNNAIEISPNHPNFESLMTTFRHELAHGMGLPDRRDQDYRDAPNASDATLNWLRTARQTEPDTTDINQASSLLHRDIALPNESALARRTQPIAPIKGTR